MLMLFKFSVRSQQCLAISVDRFKKKGFSWWLWHVVRRELMNLPRHSFRVSTKHVKYENQEGLPKFENERFLVLCPWFRFQPFWVTPPPPNLHLMLAPVKTIAYNFEKQNNRTLFCLSDHYKYFLQPVAKINRW